MTHHDDTQTALDRRVGIRLKQARDKAGLSLNEVVRILIKQGYTITPQGLGYMEKRAAMHSGAVLMDLAKIYKVTVAFFYKEGSKEWKGE